MNALPDLEKSTPETRLSFIKMAVLKVILMNNQLYTYLQSSTFDVPDYEKENIRYNSEVLNKEYEEYISEGYNVSDFQFHQKWLEEHIKDNRRIRQNVRECREMYADKSNPLYSRKKYKTIEVFPDAAEKNLPETLPMTHLCDHLLTVYHYMHDPQVALVMDYITGGVNRPSVTPGVQVKLPYANSAVNPEGYNTEYNSIMHSKNTGARTELSNYLRKEEAHRFSASVEIPSYLKTEEPHRQAVSAEIPGYLRNGEIHRPTVSVDIPSYLRNEEIHRPSQIPSYWSGEQMHRSAASAEFQSWLYPGEIHIPAIQTETASRLVAVEFPGHIVPVENPQPFHISKSRQELPNPVNLLDKGHQNYKLLSETEKAKSEKPVEVSKPPKAVGKPEILCESDLVGQILMQGTNTSKTQFQTVFSGASVSSSVKPMKPLSKLPRPVDTKLPSASAFPKKDSKLTNMSYKKQTPVHLTAKSSINCKVASEYTTKSTVSTHKVAWDVKKILAPEPKLTQKKTALPSIPQKRSRDVLADDVKDEMEAKRQRMSQWLYDHATQPTKKPSSGTKRKASLMEKSCKDHSYKRQKTGEPKQKTFTSHSFKNIARKPDIKWIKW